MPYDTYFFWVYRDAQGYWRWTFYAPNEKKIANSGEGYHNRADCEHGIALLKQHGPNAPIRYPATAR